MGVIVNVGIISYDWEGEPNIEDLLREVEWILHCVRLNPQNFADVTYDHLAVGAEMSRWGKCTLAFKATLNKNITN